MIELAVVSARGPSARQRRWGRGDIQPPGSPVLSVDDWDDPMPALDRLREWAEQYAGTAITWYLRGKRGKRLGSRLLRAAAVVLAVAGVVAALLSGDGGPVDRNLGYVLFALAVGCLAFDHFFGLSAGWVRDMASAQELQARLLRFQLDWTGWQAAQAGHGPPRPAGLPPSAEWQGGVARPVASERDGGAGAPDRVETARRLVEELVLSVSRLTGEETTGWARQFQGAVVAPRVVQRHRS